MIILILMHLFLPVMLCVFVCFKFDPTKCDVINDDILFFVSISRIHCRKFLTLHLPYQIRRLVTIASALEYVFATCIHVL